MPPPSLPTRPSSIVLRLSSVVLLALFIASLFIVHSLFTDLPSLDHLTESLVVPSAVQLCVVERGTHPATDAMQVSASAIVDDVTASTVYWNYPSQLEHNTAALHHLLRHATLYRLRLSDNPAEIVATMDNLI